MVGLFEAFSLKLVQLEQAVKSGHDELVQLLDQELQPMVTVILSQRAATPQEVHMQLKFLNGLIRDHADDHSSVVRNSAALARIIDRYFAGAMVDDGDLVHSALQPVAPPPHRHSLNDVFLNEAILDSLPDRIGAITMDYRYIYSNPANAQYLNRTQLGMIGGHVADFIDEESFYSQAKPAFDRCFTGEVVKYVHKGRRGGERFSTQCQMTPLRGSGKEILGAVIVLQKASEGASLELTV